MKIKLLKGWKRKRKELKRLDMLKSKDKNKKYLLRGQRNERYQDKVQSNERKYIYLYFT